MKRLATERLAGRGNELPRWADLPLSPSLSRPLDVDLCDVERVLGHRGDKAGFTNAPALWLTPHDWYLILHRPHHLQLLIMPLNRRNEGLRVQGRMTECMYEWVQVIKQM